MLFWMSDTREDWAVYDGVPLEFLYEDECGTLWQGHAIGTHGDYYEDAHHSWLLRSTTREEFQRFEAGEMTVRDYFSTSLSGMLYGVFSCASGWRVQSYETVPEEILAALPTNMCQDGSFKKDANG
jgi:hypothetical protein